MKRIPYTTRTGLKIGIGYEPPRYVEESGDMLRVQAALLGRGTRLGPSLRGWGSYIVVLLILLATMFVANCKGAA